LNQRPLAPQEWSVDAQAESSNITRSQALGTTTTHCAEHAAQAALSAAGVTSHGEPVVIPLGDLIDAVFEAEAWALDARLGRAESAARSEVVHRAAKAKLE
jgi:hypothetical protein